jgi:alpha-amylase
MFGWPYDQIEKECEFVGKAGYLGVKVFPPQEAILSYTTVENGELNPWWFIYQPVSYKLTSRQGTRKQFKSMIDTCRSHNVRVYADAVVNHMTGNGNDMNPDHRNGSGGACIHWGPKNGSAGSPWYTHGYQYKINPFSNQKPGLEFPSVPYDETHFHCERTLNSWTDPFILNYGWLVGLTDLNTENEYVRQRIADYISDLISIGVSGIRMDAAKHISPTNLSFILKKVKDNLNGFNEDFIAYLEVIIGGEKDLLVCNDGEYNFAQSFEKKMIAAGLSQSDVDKIKIWSSDYPKEFPICGYWPIKSERYAIGLDCHDDQFPGSSSRDMGDSGSVLVKEKNVDKHRGKTVKYNILI